MRTLLSGELVGRLFILTLEDAFERIAHLGQPLELLERRLDKGEPKADW